MTKEERAEKARVWRAANPDRAREIDQRWREKHREESREKVKRWRERNLDKVKGPIAYALRKERDPNFRKKQAIYQTIWRHRNIEKVREQERIRKSQPQYVAKKKEWNDANREKVRAYHAVGRERRRKVMLAKNILCACGCGELVSSANYNNPRYAGKGHQLRGREWATTNKAIRSPTFADLGWAAGFLEGEGSFMLQGNSQRVCASQVQREPLDRLQQLLGGAITKKIQRSAKPNHQPQQSWYVSGPRARGIMMTIYSFMSPKRQEQIKRALGEKLWASKEN